MQRLEENCNGRKSLTFLFLPFNLSLFLSFFSLSFDTIPKQKVIRPNSNLLKLGDTLYSNLKDTQLKMDGNRQQRADTRNPRVISPEVSNCNQLMRTFLRICLMTAGFGFVLLLSGIISLIKFKEGREGRVIMIVVGFFVAFFAVVFYIIIKFKLGPSKRRRFDFQTEAVYVATSQLSSVVAKNEAVSPGNDDDEPQCQRPLREEDVILASSTTPIRPSSVEQSSICDNEELSLLEILDLPPTYEEATSCQYYT